MAVEGGCYCGAVRYKIEGEAAFRGQCHCRECQFISGGAPNFTMGFPIASLSYTKGAPKAFQRSDLDDPVVREFCAECGTHLVSKPASMPMAMIKVGTLDDPSTFGGPQMAIYTCDKQDFHQIPDGIPTFEGLPG